MEQPTKIQQVFGDERNTDAFRLAILGFARIEEALNEALNDAFGGELPDDLLHTPFKVRVALAEALGLLPDAFRDPLGRLKKLRDDFSHGKLTDLSESQGRELYAAARQLFPDIETQVPALKSERQPEIHLMNLLFMLELGLEAVFDEAEERRENQETAMREWWERNAPAWRPLTSEEVVGLLSAENVADASSAEEAPG